MQLDSVQVGSKIQIVIISESLEESVKLLKFLQEKNIVPGQQHYVTEEMEVTKTIILEAGKKTAILPFDISTEIGIVVLQEPG